MFNHDKQIKDPSEVHSIEEVKEQQALLKKEIKKNLTLLAIISAILAVIMLSFKLQDRFLQLKRIQNINENNKLEDKLEKGTFDNDNLKNKNDSDYFNLKSFNNNISVRRNDLKYTSFDDNIFYIDESKDIDVINMININNNTKKVLFKNNNLNLLSIDTSGKFLTFIGESSISQNLQSFFIYNIENNHSEEFYIEENTYDISSMYLYNDHLYFTDLNFPSLNKMNLETLKITEITDFNNNDYPKIIYTDNQKITINNKNNQVIYNIKKDEYDIIDKKENTIIDDKSIFIDYYKNLKDGEVFNINVNNKNIFSGYVDDIIYNNKYIFIYINDELSIYDINNDKLIAHKNFDEPLFDKKIVLVDNKLTVINSTDNSYNIINL